MFQAIRFCNGFIVDSRAVTFTDVVKSYAGRKVLTGINLQVRQGEYTGLVGVNGAGKTTIIKCLLDFIAIDSGSISIFGQNSSQTRARENIAYLPEKFNPPYYLTGRDFLDYMTRLYRVPYDQGRIETMLGVLDLDASVLSRPVRQLSKGMSQKLGLAACLLSEKELLIMDEPMSGLDPRSRAYLKQHLLALKEKNRTLFFSTHLLNDIEVLCDRVAILHDGQVRFTGTPLECCEYYAVDDFEQAYLKCIETGNGINQTRAPYTEGVSAEG